MEWKALFSLFQSWGPTAISSVLVFVVIFLIKKQEKHESEDKQRFQDFTEQLNSRIKELRDDINRTLIEHTRELSYIKMSYITRETFYRELSGWKEDLNRLSNQLNTQFSEFMARVVEIWKGQK